MDIITQLINAVVNSFDLTQPHNLLNASTIMLYVFALPRFSERWCFYKALHPHLAILDIVIFSLVTDYIISKLALFTLGVTI